MAVVATLSAPIGVRKVEATGRRASVAQGSAVDIPIHRLTGEAAAWADRLLGIFRGVAFDGLEWSLKFSRAGLVDNRFLLGLQRAHWDRIDWAHVRRSLAISPDLWLRISADLEQANAAYFSYEPSAGAGRYRLYLEHLPADDVLREREAMLLGCGYKWDPLHSERVTTTRYRVRHMGSARALHDHLQPYWQFLSEPVLRQVAQDIVAAACNQGDASRFMWLEAAEDDSARNSFSITFRGTRLALSRFVPDLLRLATALDLPQEQLRGCFVPGEPRSLYSLQAGLTRDGSDFLTVYYD